MPRWPNKEKAEDAVKDVSVGAAVETVEKPVKVKAEPEVARAKREDFKPYTGRDSLAPFKVLEKGKDGKPDRIEYGEPGFVVHRGERKTFKVLAYYASPRGVMRKVWGVLKPTNLRPRDQKIMARLKASRIPGAM